MTQIGESGQAHITKKEEAAEEIHKGLRTWPNLPVVVVSAWDYEQDKVAALDLGGPRTIRQSPLAPENCRPGCGPPSGIPA